MNSYCNSASQHNSTFELGSPMIRRQVWRLVAAGLLLGLCNGPAAMAQSSTLNIGNASIAEGNSGSTTVNAPLTRTGDTSGNIGLRYQTNPDGGPNPATAGSDYSVVGGSAALLMAPGQTSFNLPVSVNGDTSLEPNETFLVHLLSATNAGPTPNFAGQIGFSTGLAPVSVAIGDLNGDGRPDLASSEYLGSTVSVRLNITAPGASTPSFAARQGFATGFNPRSVAIGDLNGDGRPDLAVANYSSNTVSVLLNTTSPGAAISSFAAQQTFATGVSPFSVVIGDLNGDGRRDLAVANNSSSTVSVLLNTTAPSAATSSFAAQQTFATGREPVSVAIGDVNGDGRLDLAVANIYNFTVSVLLNTTTTGATASSFAAQQTIATDSESYVVAIGDLNSDGRPDLIVTDGGLGTVSVLLNSTTPGAAMSSFAARQIFATGYGSRSVAIGDLNGDGRSDLAVGNPGSDAVSVLLNTTAPGAATSSFAAQQTFATGVYPYSVAIGDLNGDGRPDLAVTNDDPPTVSVLLNTTVAGGATPSFVAQQSFSATSPRAISLGDINGDGRADLALGSQTSNTVSVLLNTGAPGSPTLGYSAQQSFTVGSSPRALALGDLNGDGRNDLVAANFSSNTASVLFNATVPGATASTFATPTSFATGVAPFGIALGDVNGDGRSDLAFANFNSSSASILLNTTAPGATTPSFASQQTFSAGSGPRDIALRDINGDGRPDLAVANLDSNTVSVLLNSTLAGASAPSFSARQAFAVGSAPRSVTLGDLNGDGRADLVVANGLSNSVSVLFNTTAPGATTASFSASQTFATGVEPNDVALADLSGDGRLDLLVANEGGNTASVLINTTAPGDTTPSFSPQQAYATGQAPRAVAAGDLNGDGRADLAVANTVGGTVSLLVNQLYASPTIGINESVVTILNDDLAPGSIVFTDVTGVAPGSQQISNAVLITGISAPAAFSVNGGFASINGGPCTLTSGSLVNRDSIRVCHTASALFLTMTNTTLTVGTVSDTFTSTTPGSIVFNDVTGVEPGSQQISNSVLITGISAPAAFSVNGGFASINGGPCTLTSGSLFNNDSVRVCHTASASFLTTTNTTLTVGAVSDTFTSTTRGSSAPGVSIGDAQISEGNSGTRKVSLTLTLSNPATTDSSVRASTVPGSATEGLDYSRFSKTVKFVAGQTTARVSINIIGDTTPEANETFFVNLDKPKAVTIADGQALVTILNDD